MFNYIAPVTEFIFLCAGIYMYLFAAGHIKFSDFEAEAKAQKIRRKNGRWLRILGLAVAAIMTVNLYLSLTGQ